ncbi:MAG: AraC family transcriptional regulator [Clostridia bacterium]|nr:AraC family transcriptional regulator [Clostridia bacterium]
MRKIQDFYELEKYRPEDYPFVAATIGHIDVQPYIDRVNGWDLNQFLWVTDGEGIFKAQGETFQLRKGQGLFTRKNIPHGYVPLGDSFSTSWVTFLNGDGLLKLYDVGDWFVFDVPDFLESSREQLYALCQTAKTLTSRAAHGYMWATELLDAISARELSATEKIHQFLEENCGSPITLDQIAEEIGMDRFSLCKYYRKETGETIMDTLKAIRIRRAKKLLRYGFDPVAEIGRQCGYDSVSYFIKNFREETGYTPLQYRQKRK